MSRIKIEFIGKNRSMSYSVPKAGYSHNEIIKTLEKYEKAMLE